MSRFRGPVRRKGDRYDIDIGTDEKALITRLIGELRDLLTEPDPTPEAQRLLARLFPVAYPDDAEKEVEYQRLMRDELVQSKLASFDIVDDALTGQASLDEGRLVAVMQAVNSIRLVLGNMLDVTDDPAIDEVDDEHDDSPEYALYSYLSWLLEWCVRALT